MRRASGKGPRKESRFLDLQIFVPPRRNKEELKFPSKIRPSVSGKEKPLLRNYTPTTSDAVNNSWFKVTKGSG